MLKLRTLKVRRRRGAHAKNECGVWGRGGRKWPLALARPRPGINFLHGKKPQLPRERESFLRSFDWHSGETFHFCCPLKRMPSIDSIEIAVKDFSMKTLIKKLVAPGRTRINH